MILLKPLNHQDVSTPQDKILVLWPYGTTDPTYRTDTINVIWCCDVTTQQPLVLQYSNTVNPPTVTILQNNKPLLCPTSTTQQYSSTVISELQNSSWCHNLTDKLNPSHSVLWPHSSLTLSEELPLVQSLSVLPICDIKHSTALQPHDTKHVAANYIFYYFRTFFHYVHYDLIVAKRYTSMVIMGQVQTITHLCRKFVGRADLP